MLVKELDENVVNDIGHAFGYYDYGTERGLVSVCSSQEKTAAYIRGFVRAVFQSGLLYTTSERGEGYIAYKLPDQKIRMSAILPLLKGVFEAMTLKEMIHFARCMSRGGTSLRTRLDKEKKPYIYVGMVCVREKFQGQGYMRQVLDMAFKEGNRLGVPVVLDTDAKSKCDKYMHLGMQLDGTHDLGDLGTLYDLIKYPDTAAQK